MAKETKITLAEAKELFSDLIKENENLKKEILEIKQGVSKREAVLGADMYRLEQEIKVLNEKRKWKLF